MKIRSAIGLAAASLLALGLAACSNPGDGTGTSTGDGTLPASCSADNPVIGVALPNTVNPYYIAMSEGFVDGAEEQGFTVDIAIAGDSESDQLAQVQAFVQKDVCAIALNGVNSGTAVASVAAANQANIPVFTVNVIVDPDGLTTQNATIIQYVGADQTAGGRQIGEQLLKDMGADATIIAGILGAPAQIPTNQRDAGFTEALSSNPNATVLPVVDTSVEHAISLQVAGELLQAQPEMNVIFADTGPAAVGALQAVAQAGRADSVAIYAFCAADIPLEGNYKACAAQEPYEYAKIVLDNIKKYIGGADVPAEILQPLKIYLSGETVGPREFG